MSLSDPVIFFQSFASHMAFGKGLGHHNISGHMDLFHLNCLHGLFNLEKQN